MWPGAKIAVMGGEQAAGVLSTVRRDNIERAGKSFTQEEEDKFKQTILEKYDKESSSYYSTARLWDDGVINPEDTRFVLGYTLSIARRAGCEPNTSKFGVFRM